MQPLEHGCVLLQLPLQAAKPLLSLRNCRAETVPAQRTPMTSAVKNIELIFFMIALLLVARSNVPQPNDDRLFCSLRCGQLARPAGQSGLSDESGRARSMERGERA